MINSSWMILVGIGIGGGIMSIIFAIITFLKSLKLYTIRAKKDPEILNEASAAGWNSFEALRYLNSEKDNDDPQILIMKTSINWFFKKTLISILVSFASFTLLGIVIYLKSNVSK